MQRVDIALAAAEASDLPKHALVDFAIEDSKRIQVPPPLLQLSVTAEPPWRMSAPLVWLGLSVG